jgi:hypothetical protein
LLGGRPVGGPDGEEAPRSPARAQRLHDDLVAVDGQRRADRRADVAETFQLLGQPGPLPAGAGGSSVLDRPRGVEEDDPTVEASGQPAHQAGRTRCHRGPRQLLLCLVGVRDLCVVVGGECLPDEPADRDERRPLGHPHNRQIHR